MDTRGLFFAALAAFVLAACERGEPIARTPLEAHSRYCGGKALYRAGGILFCADRDARFAARTTYSVAGNATETFARQLDEVVALAHCLTGRPFEKVADGALTITIDNKIEPEKNGATHHSEGGWQLQAHLGAARTGSTAVKATNGRPAGVGSQLESGIWGFLGLSIPKAGALAESAFPEPRANAAPMREIADSARFCKDDDAALFRTGGTLFCAPRVHPYPASIGYAVIGDVAGLDAAIAAAAARVSRLTGVRFEPSRKPALLVILSERQLTKDSLGKLLAASRVTPPDDYAIEQLPADEGRLKATATTALGRVVGKPIASVVADWMTTASSSSEWSDKPNLTGVIGLHNRERIDTETEIGTKFLDVVKVSPPAYDPPSACDASR